MLTLVGVAVDDGRGWEIAWRTAAVVAIVAGCLLSFGFFSFASGFVVWSITPGRDMGPVFRELIPMFLAALCCLIAAMLVGVGLSGRKQRLMFPLAAGTFAIAAALSLSMRAGNPGAETLFRQLAFGAGLVALVTPWWRPQSR
jgi:hypothetical protein